MPRPDDASPGEFLHPALAAWMVAAAATVAGLAAGAMAVASGDPVSWKPLLLPALWSLPGALIAASRPRVAVGWLMLAVALLFAASGLAEAWLRHGGPAGWAAAAWFVDRFSAVLVPCTVLALLLIPDGRLPSRRWRPVVAVAVGVQVALVLVWALARGTAAAPDSTWSDPVTILPNPVGVVPASWGESVAGLDWLLQLPLLLCVAAVVARLRRADADERRRVVVVLLALVVFAIVVVGGRALWPPVGDLLDVLASVFLAAALVAAVLRRHLDDVAVVVHHAFVYATLGLGIALAYVLAAGLLASAGADLSPFGAGVVAAAAALAVHPLRHRLQRAVDHMMLGDRRDPYAALTRLAEHTHRALSLEEVLAAVADSVASSMRVPFVRVEAFGEAAEHGAAAGAGRAREPLMAGGAEVGSLVVAPQHGRRLRDDERALLRELGRHAGTAVDAVRLAAEVAEHHRQVVAVREEERRRLGRELHDELGPTVAGLSMQLGALRPLVHTDPATVVARLARLEAAAAEALAGIRRVAHELRPPVLDQVGLERAVAQVADSLGVVVQQEGGPVGPLPAAVELAAYRIASEALTNVARHAGARSARVSVREAGGCLVVVVEDDGRGIAAGDAAGVGLPGMRERAEEVGGTLSVRAGNDGGTTVTALLPLDPSAVASPEVGR